MTLSQNKELKPAGKIPIRFGEKLRRVREHKGYTLKTVAKAAGVSESLVSQIERNHVSPAIDTLLALAEVLDINLEFLFDEYRRKRPVHIIRKDERPVIHEDSITYEQILRPEGYDDSKAVESYIIKIPAHAHTHRGYYGHLGHDFGIIIKGTALLTYENKEYVLNEGDSISFPSSCPHVLENPGDTELEAIWGVTPPQRFTEK